MLSLLVIPHESRLLMAAGQMFNNFTTIFLTFLETERENKVNNSLLKLRHFPYLLRCKSTRKNRAETRVFKALTQGFP